MSWSNAYIGIPYQLHGRELDGLDCWGLLRAVYRNELGRELPSYADAYENTLDEEGLTAAFRDVEGLWQPVSEPREFDAVWCRVAGIECHVGVMLEGANRMLHAMLGTDSCIVRSDSPAWKRRVLQCYRLL